jgi:uncharacterized protein YbjT (DUF2867 family)
MNDAPILVAGATGLQGGGVAAALLRGGFKVRALTHDSSTDAARKLAAAGAEVVEGNFDDRDSLERAAQGATGVFSVQRTPTADDPEREIRWGRNLAEAALATGIETYVHTSVARAGDERNFASWNEGRWRKIYWESKAAVNEIVKAVGLAHWTILKPALYMEDFLPPRCNLLLPALVNGWIDTAATAATRQSLVSARDLGAFALAAFKDPSRFNAQEIPLASDALTMDEIATILSEATGKTVMARYLSEDEAIASGIDADIARTQVWWSIEGYGVDLEKVRAYGIVLDNFRDFARRQAGDFVIR